MKIEINRIPPEGLTLEDEIDSSQLDLDTEVVKFQGPIKINASISKITNTVTVDLALAGREQMICSRCLSDFGVDLKKKFRLIYPVDKSESQIDLDPNIKEEIVLGYPMKPLCKKDCQGLCPKCGKNLNDGRCDCASKNKSKVR